MSNHTVHVELHQHPHDHHHDHSEESVETRSEELVLMEYMLHHNEDHLEEFVDVMEKLRSEGKDDAADLLQEAIDLMEDADIKLADVVELLKGEE